MVGTCRSILGLSAGKVKAALHKMIDGGDHELALKLSIVPVLQLADGKLAIPGLAKPSLGGSGTAGGSRYYQCRSMRSPEQALLIV